jgi:kynurenine formamidase
VDWLTASYLVIQSDHVGTHCDALKHIEGPDAPGPEGIPLEYCYADGVVLDFRHKAFGEGISAAEIDEALDRIGYQLKERDIVLIQTGASAYNTEQRYLTDHCGMTAEATRYLISQGVRLMGIDAVTFDPPVWAMFERKQFWEAHLVMKEEPYWHIENLTNLDQLPSYGFKLSVFPIKWVGTTGAPVRAVAIVDD